MLILTHPACLAHDTGPGHAERPQRLDAVTEALREAFDAPDWREAPRATRGQLLRVHAASLLDAVLETRPSERILLDPDTVLSPDSAEAALRAAGAGVAAVDAMLSGDADTAFCAVRPPGHHATADTAMGFCLFNSVAVAAAHALDAHGLARVAIADFDVHHGNGTQEIFWTDPSVLYASCHQSPLYPGTGRRNEVGAGPGLDFTLNRPLGPGSGDEQYLHWAEGELARTLRTYQPNFLLVSAGYDAHAADPMAQLEVSTEGFGRFTAVLAALADELCGGRLVAVLEGGYELGALVESVAASLEALAG